MSHKMLIDGNHPEETRVVVVSGNKVENFDFESQNKNQVSGNIYLAKVTRVEPSLQAAFLDYGGNRHGFLAFSEIHPDYYQIPKKDKEKLLEEARKEAQLRDEEIDTAVYEESQTEEKPKSRKRRRKKTNSESIAEEVSSSDEIIISDVIEEDPKEGSGKKVQKSKTQTSSGSKKNNLDNQDLEGKPDLKLDDNDLVSESTTDETDFEVRRAALKRTKSLLRKYNIQEVIKVRQIMLIQVVKEERGNKGAALTSYLSLAGRYCVLMPNTTRGGGISRKITNQNDRRRLKDIIAGITVPDTAGLIIRTAGINRTKLEIKRDYEYLIRQWETIRDLTLKSIAPTLVYEEGGLIKRSIRDLYNKPTEEIIVQGEDSYLEAKEYMKMLMPSHAKNVKKYSSAIPLFSRYQVETHLTAMFNPNVQLKSGGYIVIGITEALVAIDVNSGRSTRETSIEETALKTNLEASEEIARQLRLRDLAGLIVIDFIDMEDRKNNNLVEKTLYEKIKTDRARIQLGKISTFGLLEMSRQRLRSGMVEATTQPCPHCFGTGTTRSNESLGLAILRDIQQEVNLKAIKRISIDCSVEVANFLLNNKRAEISNLEKNLDVEIHVKGERLIVNPDYKIVKEKIDQKFESPTTEDGEIPNARKSKNVKNNNNSADLTNQESDKRKTKRKRKKTPDHSSPSVEKPQVGSQLDDKAASDKHLKNKRKHEVKKVDKDLDKSEKDIEKSSQKEVTSPDTELKDSSISKVTEVNAKVKKEQKKRLTSADIDQNPQEEKKPKGKRTSKKSESKKVGWWSREKT